MENTITKTKKKHKKLTAIATGL